MSNVVERPEDITSVGNPKPLKLKHPNIEGNTILLLTTRLGYLKNDILAQFKELKKRQDAVSELNKTIQALTTNKNEGGDIDFSNNEELKTLFKRAKELGVNIDEQKTKYTKDQLNDAIGNIKMTVEDLNVRNEQQLHETSRLNSERYESFQLARAIMKPLHDDKINKARAAGGR